MNRRTLLKTLGASIVAAQLPPARAQDNELFAQSASAALHREFASGNLSWILLDRSGRLLDSYWRDRHTPVSPGSLLKPFVALAYAEQHSSAFPHVHCSGTSDRCWLPRGHGLIGLEDALAQSCNAYFLSLAAHIELDRGIRALRPLGLAGPPQSATPATLIGLTNEWREAPLPLARAFLALQKVEPPARDRIASGMQKSAQAGTAAALDSALGHGAVLAKTGTAACTHHPRATADGFSVVLYPAAQPRILLLLRMHAATGAQTSARAAAMLSALGLASA